MTLIKSSTSVWSFGAGNSDYNHIPFWKVDRAGGHEPRRFGFRGSAMENCTNEDIHLVLVVQKQGTGSTGVYFKCYRNGCLYGCRTVCSSAAEFQREDQVYAVIKRPAGSGRTIVKYARVYGEALSGEQIARLAQPRVAVDNQPAETSSRFATNNRSSMAALDQESLTQTLYQGEDDGGPSSPHSKASTRHSFVILWDGLISDWSEHQIQILEQALLDSKVDLLAFEGFYSRHSSRGKLILKGHVVTQEVDTLERRGLSLLRRALGAKLCRFEIGDSEVDGTSLWKDLDARLSISDIPRIKRTVTGASPAPSPALNLRTLRVAYECALLSNLAYRDHVFVEALRQEANSGEETQANVPAVKSSNDSDDLTAAQREAYLGVLKQFKNKTDCHYFDGGIANQSSQAYFFFAETPENEKNVLYVAFRGTQLENEGGRDVLADADFALVDALPQKLIHKENWGPLFKGGKMELHKGFLGQFLALADSIDSNAEARVKARRVEQTRALDPIKMEGQIVNALNDPRAANGNLEVIVTGHSLGAALATIGSFVAAINHPTVKISCYNFGSPRVGNKAFADFYETVMVKAPVPAVPGEVYRFAADQDPVPHVPTPPGYHHVPVGGYKLVEKDGTVESVPLPPEDWTKFNFQLAETLVGDAVTWFKKHLPGFTFTKDHSMQLYADHIRFLKESLEKGTSAS